MPVTTTNSERPLNNHEINAWATHYMQRNYPMQPEETMGCKDCIRDIRRCCKRRMSVLGTATRVYEIVGGMAGILEDAYSDPYFYGYTKTLRSYINRWGLMHSHFPGLYY